MLRDALMTEILLKFTFEGQEKGTLFIETV